MNAYKKFEQTLDELVNVSVKMGRHFLDPYGSDRELKGSVEGGRTKNFEV